MDDGDLEIYDTSALYGPTYLDEAPLEEAMPQKSWRGEQKERSLVLGRKMSSVLKSLKNVAGSGFEV